MNRIQLTVTFILVVICFFSCKTTKTDQITPAPNSFILKPGDLLFQDSDCGPFCSSIEKVTFGYHGANLSHIGMVLLDQQNNYQVIEAISEGVVLTDLATFLDRSHDENGNSKVIVGRIDDNHQALIPHAIQFARSKLGLAYDEIFDITNNKYYCSELIYDAFKAAHNNIPLFYLQKMTFVDPDTKKTFPIWDEYYKELGTEIPEGKPGLNPGGISLSKYIDIVHMYGVPDGYSPVGVSSIKY